VQRSLLRQSPGFFEENSPSEISSRMTADTAQIEHVVGTTISVALRNAIMVVGGTAYLFYLTPLLTAALVGVVAVVIPLIALFGRRVRAVSRESQDRVADVGSMVSEVLGAMKIVQGFNQEARESARFADAVERAFATARRRIVLRATMTVTVIAFVFGAITLLMWRGAVQVAEGSLSGGTIAAFVLTGMIVAGAFGALTEVYGDLLRGAGAASRLNELLRAKPDIAPPARPQALPEPPRGSLAFDRVTFRYPTRPDTPAIADFSLAVELGETVAIVGPSGAGKSTVFQLAERFYDPHLGTVRIDGVPLTSADPADVRRRLALVPQEGTLFAASARDNLRYGAWDASEEAIWEAARAANAEEFLQALPQGLDTFLGEGGARLSGGQRQRVAIARALLRDAPILLLDEATSALDAESERLVQQALERLMKDRTTLVIAHRLATVRAADRIVVMDAGRIVEQGTHGVLQAAGGLYARLAALQFEDAAA
jgi:ATP-binding cassette subfamily B protein